MAFRWTAAVRWVWMHYSSSMSLTWVVKTQVQQHTAQLAAELQQCKAGLEDPQQSCRAATQVWMTCQHGMCHGRAPGPTMAPTLSRSGWQRQTQMLQLTTLCVWSKTLLSSCRSLSR